MAEWRLTIDVDEWCRPCEFSLPVGIDDRGCRVQQAPEFLMWLRLNLRWKQSEFGVNSLWEEDSVTNENLHT